ncbi:MAG: ATP-dependent Clp protease ATP-binding subunit, partial [Acidobacteria bacterium]|nr:ATP-dependent Clp protease ATP-binding subunit [Acidobacteriota bacterium]
FQAVRVNPPTEIEAIEIIRGIKDRYESFHQVVYNDQAITSSVYQSNRYIPDRFLPDKAIDVLDEAGARVKLRSTAVPEEVVNLQKKIKIIMGRIETAIAMKEFEKAARCKDEELLERENLQIIKDRWKLRNKLPVQVTRDDIDDVVARWTGIPVASLKDEETQKLLRMEAELHRRIVSQEKAISAISRAIRRTRAGLKNPNRPVGSFLFLGPTGVGKTEVAKSLADFLLGTEKALIRFDMSEYMEKHSVSKLIGSPPGYVGHEEGGQLTERIKRNPYSVLLLDEIEKAHSDIFNILLQVFEDGQLTDSQGNQIDFKNTIIIMTSNIGARFLTQKSVLGFQVSVDRSQQKIQDLVLNEVKHLFNPEFLNRLDEIILFESLTDADLVKIVDLLMKQVNRNLEQKSIRIRLEQEVADWIIAQTCRDRSYGARPLRRAIQKYIEDPVSELIIQGKLNPDRTISIYLHENQLFYRPADAEKDQGSQLQVAVF